MRILFDHGTPAPLAVYLNQHIVHKAVEKGWDQLSNGELLTVAEAEGYELLLTTDKNILYQQNLAHRKISIVVLGIFAWPILRLHVDKVLVAVETAKPGESTLVEIE
jgi:hypothetical protein